MLSRSLKEGKTTELKQFLKSIILTPKIANKNIAFLFVLSKYNPDTDRRIAIHFHCIVELACGALNAAKA